MRSFFRSHWKALVAIVLLVLLALVTVNPGAATLEPPLAVRLRAHVMALQSSAAFDKPDARRADAAAYIGSVLRMAGYRVRQLSPPDGGGHDLEATLGTAADVPAHGQPEHTFVIGARLDPLRLDAEPDGTSGSFPLSTRDDAGGAAAVLELARLLKDVRPSPGTEIRFVFFLDPRPVQVPARPAGQRHGRLAGPRGQSPLRPRVQPQVQPLPGSGSFIAYVGTPGSARRVQDALAAFQAGTEPDGHGLAAPAYMQGVTLSAGAYGQMGAGMPTLTVTDTAFDQFPFRQIQDDDEEGFDSEERRDPRDYDGIGRVVAGMARTLIALAAGQRG
ncbi:hypothetical protein [Massilia sp. TN1-12]|uniref:hypothetical protein n=1 Tax=Massilia paldalensis TaxID=3377675 RepID=UPI00384AFAED